jgi:hypothetical protein
LLSSQMDEDFCVGVATVFVFGQDIELPLRSMNSLSS